MIRFSHFQHIMKFSYEPVAIDTQGTTDQRRKIWNMEILSGPVCWQNVREDWSFTFLDAGGS